MNSKLFNTEELIEANNTFKKLKEELDKPVAAGSVFDVIYHAGDYAKIITANILKPQIEQQTELINKLQQTNDCYKAQESRIKEIESYQKSLRNQLSDLTLSEERRIELSRRLASSEADLIEAQSRKNDLIDEESRIKQQILAVDGEIKTLSESAVANADNAAKIARQNYKAQIDLLPPVEKQIKLEGLINDGKKENADIQQRLNDLTALDKANVEGAAEREKERVKLKAQLSSNEKEIANLEKEATVNQDAYLKVLERTKAGSVEAAAIRAKGAAQDAKIAEDEARRLETEHQEYLDKMEERFKKKKEAGEIDENISFEDWANADDTYGSKKQQEMKEAAEEARKIADEKQKAAEKLAAFEKASQAEVAGEQAKADQARQARLKDMGKIQRGFKSLPDALTAKKKEEAAAKLDAAETKKSAAAQSKLAAEEAKAKLDPNSENDQKEYKKLLEQIAKAEEEMAEADKEAEDANKENAAAENMEKAIKGLQNTMSAAFNEMNDAMDNYNQYAAKIDARLQGSDTGYEEVVDLVKSNLALSPLVKTKEVMEKINEAIDHGLTYNLEQRAFLETISEKIADTFDAFDANLLRLIRLQQADSTAARLGMEATLTKMLNNMFEDTSYLTADGAADSVAGAIIDAQSQMTRDQALEFEFTVQKWLGSLGSLGMSNETLAQIAQGINYLGTGNVEALSGNEQLQTLIAMSASEAGLSLADMLVQGLTSDDTNKLLKSMVEYLKEIAEDDNQVVKSAYGGIFNMSQSDMRAISNLTSSDISSIASQSLSYNQALNETQQQLIDDVWARTPISEMMDNVYDNLITSLATGIADNPAQMATWKINDFIESQTGGINIPFITAMGTGIGLEANVNQLIKLGMAGISLIGQIPNMYSSLTSKGGTDLAGWGGEEYTSRGSGFVGITQGASSTTSQSAYVGNASGEDASDSTISSASEDAQETGKITNAGMEQEHTFDDFYKALLEDKEYVKAEVTLPDDSPPVKVRLEEIREGLLENSVVTAQLVNEQFSELVKTIAAIMTIANTSISEGDGTTPALSAIQQYTIAYSENQKYISDLINTTSVDGSHAGGLNTVPFDGYIAELHEGEAVLTKEQAEQWRGDSTSSEPSPDSNVVSNIETVTEPVQDNFGLLDARLSELNTTIADNLGEYSSINKLLGSSGALNSTLGDIVEKNIDINNSLSAEGILSRSLSTEGDISSQLSAEGALSSAISDLITTNSDALGIDGAINSSVVNMDVNSQAALGVDGTLNSALTAMSAENQALLGPDGTLNTSLNLMDANSQALLGLDGALNNSLINMSAENQALLGPDGTLNTSLSLMDANSQAALGVDGTLNSALTAMSAENQALLGPDGTLNASLVGLDSTSSELFGQNGPLNTSLNSLLDETNRELGAGGTIDLALGPDGVLSNALTAENTLLSNIQAAEADAAAASLSKTTEIYNDLFGSENAKQVNVAISEDDGGIKTLKELLVQILSALIGNDTGKNLLSTISAGNKNTQGIINALGATTEDGKGSISIAALIEKLNELASDPVGLKTHVANDMSGINGNALDTMAHVLTLGGAL